MSVLKRSHLEKIPFLGEMLFSMFTFPVAFTFLEKWVASEKAADTDAWLCALYAMLAMVHLFRAFRLRRHSRSAFIAQMIYSVAFGASSALLALTGLTLTTVDVAVLTFIGYMLSERVLDIVRHPKPWRIALDVLAVALIIVFMFDPRNTYTIVVVGFVAAFSSLLTIMYLILSRIRLDILKEIVQKTYALEIIAGLLVTMVAFSNVLTFTDDAFPSFWDTLWYCFAIVTTIGFGDLTPTTGTGRFLSIILGIYGIVVVALITSIIVNFYGELKKKDVE